MDECKPLPTGVDMLAACLAPEPSARPTAGELLSMAYFHGVPESFSDAFHDEVEANRRAVEKVDAAAAAARQAKQVRSKP